MDPLITCTASWSVMMRSGDPRRRAVSFAKDHHCSGPDSEHLAKELHVLGFGKKKGALGAKPL